MTWMKLISLRLQMYKWRVAHFQFDIEKQGEDMIQSLLTLIKKNKMRKKNAVISIFTISFLLFACDSSSLKEAHKHSESVTEHENQQNGREDKIRLNNGEKWLVNDEMKPYVYEAEKVLSEYNESNSTEYKELAVVLKEKNTAVIKSCTMQGESHDELHKWLHPHMELVDKLEKADNVEEANETITQLNESFETYNQYFQ